MDEPKFPEEIQCRITDEFLITFKQEWDKILIKYFDILHKNLHKHKATYWNFYQWFDNSCDFNKALFNACELHNLKDLYQYREDLGCYYNEPLGIRLTEMLCERGIIEEGKHEDVMPCPYN